MTYGRNFKKSECFAMFFHPLSLSFLNQTIIPLQFQMTLPFSTWDLVGIQ